MITGELIASEVSIDKGPQYTTMRTQLSSVAPYEIKYLRESLIIRKPAFRALFDFQVAALFSLHSVATVQQWY